MFCDGPDNGFRGRYKGYYYWLYFKYRKGHNISNLSYEDYKKTWKPRVSKDTLKTIAGVSRA